MSETLSPRLRHIVKPVVIDGPSGRACRFVDPDVLYPKYTRGRARITSLRVTVARGGFCEHRSPRRVYPVGRYPVGQSAVIYRGCNRSQGQERDSPSDLAGSLHAEALRATRSALIRLGGIPKNPQAGGVLPTPCGCARAPLMNLEEQSRQEKRLDKIKRRNPFRHHRNGSTPHPSSRVSASRE